MLNLTSVMALIPFFLVAAYALLVVRRGETYEKMRPQERTRDMFVASIAVIYTLFLIYSAGLKFLVLSAIIYGPGTILYFWARREQGKTIFTRVEWAIFAAAMIGCAIGIHGLATGYITV
jgi:arginine:ornithine antiporter/lysine permease